MNFSRRIRIAIGLSLLAHAALLVVTPLQPKREPPGPIAQVPLTVRIEPPELPAPKPEPAPPAPPEPPRVAPRPPPPPPAPAPRPRPRVEAPAPPPPPPAEPDPVPKSDPPPIEVPPRAGPPPVDMLAAIRERRARREAERAQAPTVPPPRKDAVARNLETLTGREGVGGVFEVLRVGVRTGEFAFNGWRPDARSQWREVIEVDAGLGGNVELAMVRRMIELIRTHYDGDFRWESHRLGRVMVLSARPEHSAELEDFLMREFFGTPVLNPRREAGRR